MSSYDAFCQRLAALLTPHHINIDSPIVVAAALEFAGINIALSRLVKASIDLSSADTLGLRIHGINAIQSKQFLHYLRKELHDKNAMGIEDYINTMEVIPTYEYFYFRVAIKNFTNYFMPRFEEQLKDAIWRYKFYTESRDQTNIIQSKPTAHCQFFHHVKQAVNQFAKSLIPRCGC